MTQIDSACADLLTDKSLSDNLREWHYIAMREVAEKKRDLAQLEMDLCDKKIHELQKQKVTG